MCRCLVLREGVLLYVVNGRIEARRFDSGTLSLVGDARAICLVSGGNDPDSARDAERFG